MTGEYTHPQKQAEVIGKMQVPNVWLEVKEVGFLSSCLFMGVGSGRIIRVMFKKDLSEINPRQFYC